MLSLLKKLLHHKFVGFSLVGGGIFLLGFFLLWLQNDLLSLNKIYAQWFETFIRGIGYHGEINSDLTGKVITNLFTTVVSVESNFFLNKFVNWRERPGGFLSQWLKFHLTRLTTITLNQLLSAFIIYAPIFDLSWHNKNYDYLVAAIMTTALGMIINFLGNEKFVFREKTQKELVIS